MPETSFAGLVFTEAVDFLQRRLDLPSQVFLDLAREVDAAAQDRALGMKDAMVRSILEAIVRSLEEGTTASAFRDEFDAIAQANGWKGDNSEGWRSALTFRTTTAQAMAAGRWEQIQRLKARRPWVRYVGVLDDRIREEHRAWHGIILHADHVWWHTHAPPNGFNCRCHLQSLSDADLRRYGLKVTLEPPTLDYVIRTVRDKDGVLKQVAVPKGIDPGFAYNPGEVSLKLFGPLPPS
jgi:SPP1 gp7 family putative phage head morphogenesis protein